MAEAKAKVKTKVSFKEASLKALRFPIDILKLSGSGINLIKRRITGKDFDFSYLGRLEGDALAEEFNKVKKQGTELKTKSHKKEDAKEYSFYYEARNEFGNIEKGTFEGPTLTAVKNFLDEEYEEVLLVKPRSKFDVDINLFAYKFKADQLAFFLTQMATYLRAGITLVDGVRIMVKQSQNKAEKKVYQKIVYSLVRGDDFSKALSDQGDTFPSLLISMVKTSELTGDLPLVLDEMADYYTKIDKNRRELRGALAYPAVILIVALFAVIFILTKVIPQFRDMFESVGGKLPGITVFVLSLSKFITTKGWIFLLVLFIVNVFLVWFYKNNRNFKRKLQTVFMKTPVFGDLIICNEVSNLTRTFATLLNHGVFITDSMEVLSSITKNEVYKSIIYRCLIGLSKGAKLSDTFKGEWAFPVIAYEMLATGESTGQLGQMMEKVSNYYANIHEAKSNSLKSILEPMIIIFLAVIIGFILLSVIVPMFSLYQQI